MQNIVQMAIKSKFVKEKLNTLTNATTLIVKFTIESTIAGF